MFEQLEITEPMEDVVCLQSDFLGSKSMSERKALGQFFTGSTIADYMASLVQAMNGKPIRILDAGAGTGILSVSTALRLLHLKCTRVHAVLYEIDREAIPSLAQTLKIVEDIYTKNGAVFTYEILEENFILSRPDKERLIKPFDIAVINPPYFKYSVKDSAYSKATADLYSGDPNIYASFMAVTMACLKKNGQMISITPRSFTNGLYFKGLRDYLLSESALDYIHIFKRRDKVFKSEETSVLQENIICKFIKGESKSLISIASSDCGDSVNNASIEQYSKELIIDSSNKQKMIRIPESLSDANILKKAERLDSTFEGSGYFISTGRVVEHRTRDYITADNGCNNSIPLYRPHNIKPLLNVWSGDHKKDVSFRLDEEHEKHTMKNGIYVLLKRFTSKDEKRRLVAGIHTESMHNCELIGFGNKTNYVGLSGGELTLSEAYGLGAIFNSSFMDMYFRCVSGNTQVNATEIRVMKFPSRDQVKEIGEAIISDKDFSLEKIDSIFDRVIGIINII